LLNLANFRVHRRNIGTGLGGVQEGLEEERGLG